MNQKATSRPALSFRIKVRIWALQSAADGSHRMSAARAAVDDARMVSVMRRQQRATPTFFMPARIASRMPEMRARVERNRVSEGGTRTDLRVEIEVVRRGILSPALATAALDRAFDAVGKKFSADKITREIERFRDGNTTRDVTWSINNTYRHGTSRTVTDRVRHGGGA